MALLITWQGWWTALVAGISGQSPLALGVGFPVVLTLLLGGAAWLALRRATP